MKKNIFLKFRQCPPRQQEWAVLSLHETDKLRLVTSSRQEERLVRAVDTILQDSGMVRAVSQYWR